MANENAYPQCWLFDENHRVYKKDAAGRSTGGPIWREHWVRVEIVGETPRSWITVGGQKVPKKGDLGVAFSEEEIDRAEFVENRWRIAQAVQSCRDYETLRKIADLVGL